MTGSNREQNAQAEVRRAEQTLRAAEALLQLGMWNDAVARAYYVAFHASCALLVHLGLQARSHRGVHSLVVKHLVEPGILAPEHATRLARLEERRAVADYRALEDIDADQARALVADARILLSAACALLRTRAPG
jgi:uncharacterized protein (UPF0332 family)